MERDFDVTKVSKVSNTAEPQLKGLTWDEVLRQLSVSGMTRSLAQRCVMHDVLGQRIEFLIDHDHFDFFNEVNKARLRAALSEFMNENVTIEIIAGEANFLSPLQKLEKKRAELQAEAEQEIRNDIHVNALIQRFGATVIEQSIEPIIREL
nr:DNA polymerase III subunit gamma/tau C-terminal domain-containing protein [Hahella sp. CCB-MM4]